VLKKYQLKVVSRIFNRKNTIHIVTDMTFLVNPYLKTATIAKEKSIDMGIT